MTLNHDTLLSNYAFNCNWRHYTKDRNRTFRNRWDAQFGLTLHIGKKDAAMYIAASRAYFNPIKKARKMKEEQEREAMKLRQEAENLKRLGTSSGSPLLEPFIAKAGWCRLNPGLRS